jgi:hypothetical protein
VRHLERRKGTGRSEKKERRKHGKERMNESWIEIGKKTTKEVSNEWKKEEYMKN